MPDRPQPGTRWNLGTLSAFAVAAVDDGGVTARFDGGTTQHWSHERWRYLVAVNAVTAQDDHDTDPTPRAA